MEQNNATGKPQGSADVPNQLEDKVLKTADVLEEGLLLITRPAFIKLIDILPCLVYNGKKKMTGRKRI